MRKAGGCAVLFDVDGTLVDTNWLHTVAWWRAFRALGRDVPMHVLHHNVGKGADQFIPAVLGEVNPELRKALDAAHADFYAPDLYGLIPLPGAGELLRAVASAGVLVVLASSCSSTEAHHLRDALAADDVVSAMTDAADVAATKPRPDVIAAALGKVDVPADRAVFVGDSIWDVQACEQAGLACIGLECGGTAGRELLAAGAVAVHRDPAHLLARLHSSPIGRLIRSACSGATPGPAAGTDPVRA
jgi:HAD superfamily hydrolase (TIGR01509 family)